MDLCNENGITHIRYEAGLQYKGDFVEAAAKKFIVPTGVKLKLKEVNKMISAAKENNDDPYKRAEFFNALALQIEKNEKGNPSFNEGTHPLCEIGRAHV